MKNVMRAGVIGAAAALALAACGQAPDEGGSTTAGGKSDFKGCVVSDSGGFNDKSFNESAYNGLLDAQKELGIQTAQAESKADDQYATNISNLQSQNCNIIVTVGFKLATATGDAAQKSPDTKFAIVDSPATDAKGKALDLDNVKSIQFDTAQAAFLAGYLAAGMTKTGVVGTFGGLQIPTVTVFMDGFADGVAKYNEVKGKSVKVEGWNKETQKGLFDGGDHPFDAGSGKSNADTLIDSKNADIILPVAGGAGVDALTAAKDAGDVSVIWVDSDGTLTNPDATSLIMTSVMKEISTAVDSVVTDTANGSFDNTPYVGTLENKGVGLAPYHDFASKIPQDLQDEVTQLQQDIISGKIVVQSDGSPKSGS
ncbi:BMP family lipoprotein [Luteimicrobium subarcticum]|uniref:Nucleoside-binding protein n=1 Tax=Luteimicrobium subarcticum TaxID=620910 RepID=A0A2M8WUH1_9MICO|nr:BMP family ABC transporter substrate-binding protein [Luteimicrobium subarcticum]PJI94595.1 nucleoside-binding protein [Luteimicrobium subarcticum]